MTIALTPQWQAMLPLIMLVGATLVTFIVMIAIWLMLDTQFYRDIEQMNTLIRQNEVQVEVQSEMTPTSAESEAHE